MAEVKKHELKCISASLTTRRYRCRWQVENAGTIDWAAGCYLRRTFQDGMRCEREYSNTITHTVEPKETVVFEIEAEVDCFGPDATSEWEFIGPDENFTRERLECRIDSVDLAFLNETQARNTDSVTLVSIEGVTVELAHYQIALSQRLVSYSKLRANGQLLVVATQTPKCVIDEALELQYLFAKTGEKTALEKTCAKCRGRFEHLVQLNLFASIFRLHAVQEATSIQLWDVVSSFDQLLELNKMYFTGHLTQSTSYLAPSTNPSRMVPELLELNRLGVFIMLNDFYHMDAEEEGRDRLWLLMSSNSDYSKYEELHRGLSQRNDVTVQACQIQEEGHMFLEPVMLETEWYSRDRQESGAWSPARIYDFDVDKDPTFDHANIVNMEPILFAIVAKPWRPVNLRAMVIDLLTRGPTCLQTIPESPLDSASLMEF